MRTLCLAFAAVVTLVVSLEAHATDESEFLGTTFTPGGTNTGFASCEGNGGTVTVISK